MPPSKKRKLAQRYDTPKDDDPTMIVDETRDGDFAHQATSPARHSEGDDQSPNQETVITPRPVKEDVRAKAKERQERFKALQTRAKKSAERNLKEAAAESQRLAGDANALHALARKQTVASHNLLKADIIANGDDFERKRAWDWTVDEAEKWDKRMEKKERHRQDVPFHDYHQESRKVYKRQIRGLKPDLDGYEKEKMAAVQRAAASGELDIVETDDGELVAIDQSGTFYTSADSTDFVESRPDRAAVDRLVADLRQADASRLRQRRDRGKAEDEPDVTYINDKNKQFNQKLARFYNKYTAEIRDSFERGTMI